MNTRKKYERVFGVWSRWASKYRLLSLPASESDVSVYLVSIIQKNNSFATVDEAFYAIRWAHELAGYDSNNPCSSFFVKSVREAAHMILGHSVSKKEPITAEILKQLVNIYGCDNANLYQLRSMLMCLLAYAGFLRFSELVNIRRSDIGFNLDHIALFIETSKTDIYRDGNWCLIAKTACDTCPVKMLERYINSAGIQQDSDEYIFRSLTYYKINKSYKLRGLGPLSYSRERELLHEMLDCIGLNKKLYGIHSLRSGGASSAANGGVPDRLFKRHGRWRSERAKDMYVKDDIEKRLLVSKCLGI